MAMENGFSNWTYEEVYYKNLEEICASPRKRRNQVLQEYLIELKETVRSKRKEYKVGLLDQDENICVQCFGNPLWTFCRLQD